MFNTGNNNTNQAFGALASALFPSAQSQLDGQYKKAQTNRQQALIDSERQKQAILDAEHQARIAAGVATGNQGAENFAARMIGGEGVGPPSRQTFANTEAIHAQSALGALLAKNSADAAKGVSLSQGRNIALAEILSGSPNENALRGASSIASGGSAKYGQHDAITTGAQQELIQRHAANALAKQAADPRNRFMNVSHLGSVFDTATQEFIGTNRPGGGGASIPNGGTVPLPTKKFEFPLYYGAIADRIKTGQYVAPHELSGYQRWATEALRSKKTIKEVRENGNIRYKEVSSDVENPAGLPITRDMARRLNIAQTAKANTDAAKREQAAQPVSGGQSGRNFSQVARAISGEVGAPTGPEIGRDYAVAVQAGLDLGLTDEQARDPLWNPALKDVAQPAAQSAAQPAAQAPGPVAQVLSEGADAQKMTEVDARLAAVGLSRAKPQTQQQPKEPQTHAEFQARAQAQLDAREAQTQLFPAPKETDGGAIVPNATQSKYLGFQGVMKLTFDRTMKRFGYDPKTRRMEKQLYTPKRLGTLVDNSGYGEHPYLGEVINHDDRAYFSDAQAILNTILRTDSGAAVILSEYPNYRKVYIPSVLDPPNVVEQKLQNIQAIQEAYDIVVKTLKPPTEGLGPGEKPDRQKVLEWRSRMFEERSRIAARDGFVPISADYTELDNPPKKPE